MPSASVKGTKNLKFFFFIWICPSPAVWNDGRWCPYNLICLVNKSQQQLGYRTKLRFLPDRQIFSKRTDNISAPLLILFHYSTLVFLLGSRRWVSVFVYAECVWNTRFHKPYSYMSPSSHRIIVRTFNTSVLCVQCARCASRLPSEKQVIFFQTKQFGCHHAD